jgi:hypothetical protein
VTRAELDALYDEVWPTGSFGGRRIQPSVDELPLEERLLIEERPADPYAAEHVAELLKALDEHDADLRRGHLRLVADDERAAS